MRAQDPPRNKPARKKRWQHGPTHCSRHSRRPAGFIRVELRPNRTSYPSVTHARHGPRQRSLTTALRGGLNWSAQHFNLLAKMECGHETATSHLLLGGPAIRDLGSLAGRRADEFDRTPI